MAHALGDDDYEANAGFVMQTRDLPCANLIPFELQGEVFCLKAEDHYLRVFSSAGEALVLFRFSDAIKPLSRTLGLQIHRSYWVAKTAVSKTVHHRQRHFLILTNGHSVPVSRARVHELREAGWLATHRRQTMNRPSFMRQFANLWKLSFRWQRPAFRWQRPAIASIALSLGLVVGATLIVSNTKPQGAGISIPAETAFTNGWREYLLDTPDSFTRAARHFHRAVAIDESFGKAYGALASLYHSASVRGWNKQWGLKLHETYRLAHQNLLDAARHPSAEGHAAEAQALLYRRRVEEAMVESARAIAIDPKNPTGHLWMANSLIMVGLPNQATAFLDQAKSLGHPGSPSTLWARGMAAFVNNDFNAAANYFEQCIAESPAMNAMPLVATYGHLGRRDEAQGIIKRERAQRTAVNPLNLVTVMDGMIFRRKEDAKRFVIGLRLAGI